jgi:PAS domain S-box-containing protein
MNDASDTKKPLMEELSIRRRLAATSTSRKAVGNSSGRTFYKSDPQLKALLEAFDGLIYVCSPDYRIAFMNAQLVVRTGYDGTGESCYKVLHDRDSICPWCVNERVFNGETVRWEIQSPKDNRWYYAVNTPIYLENGTIYKQSVMLDITGRKQAEEALRQAHADLERKVAERTAELVLKNRQLSEEVEEHRRTAQMLRQSEEKYKSVVDNIGIGIALISPDMEILTMNNQMKAWFPHIEVDRQPLCYRAFNQPPGESICSYCPTYKTLQDGQLHKAVTETPARRRTRNYKIIASPIKDSRGKVLAAIEMVEDITENKKMQARLQNSEALYRTIFETTACATMIVEEDYTISLVNTEFEKLSGFTKAQIEGNASWTEFVADADLDRMREYHQLRRRDSDKAPRNYEFSVRNRKSQVKDVFATVAMLPGTTQSVLSLMDITERKRSEAALCENEAHLRALMDTIPDPLVVYDASGVVIYINTAFTTTYGWSPEELLGRRIDSIPPEETENTRVAWERAMRRERFLFETKRSTKTGKTLDVELAIAILFDQENQRKASIVIHRDVTERKKAQRALQASAGKLRYFSSRLQSAQEEERKRIARDLHDSIGQSLALIKLQVENTLKSIQTGHRPVDGMVETLNDLLPTIQDCIEEVRRICTGLRPDLLDHIGIIATIGWFCRNFHLSCPEIFIEQTIDVAEEAIPEPLKIVIFRILQEALSNVSKYGQATSVHVDLAKKDGLLQLVIKDNGTGFDAEAVLAKDGCDRGLGLTSMRERTELSGGRFNLESTIGQGTTIAAVWPGSD